jgi:competence protein ComEA
MKSKRIFDLFFLLTKSERNGAIILLSIIGLLLLTRLLLPVIFSSNEIIKYEFNNNIAEYTKDKDSTIHFPIIEKGKRVREEYKNERKITREFDKSNENIAISGKVSQFNPNQVSYEELVKIGFSQRAARNLINYRSKGGVFKTPDDVKKIYGVDSVFYTSIHSFILISKEPDVQVFLDVNEADSSEFTRLKGIGPVFASRICKYRNQLGGFISIDQLKEVYKFPLETYNEIKEFLTLDNSGVKKINVNFAGIDELKKHPYCKYTNARRIIDYRSKKGYIQALESLVNDSVIDSFTYMRFSPYLKTE